MNRIGILTIFVIFSPAALANIEFAMVSSCDPSGFHEKWGNQCIAAQPELKIRMTDAFVSWKRRNEAKAVKVKEACFAFPPLQERARFIIELGEMEEQILLQLKNQSDMQGICSRMPTWLESQDSDIENIVLPTLLPK
ncbi:hypothetical protein [Rhodoferax sp.]|uniref:hypothetical protein n=1 Tax=Rhodoferax sp. TaxID=50421 RepID=UPI001EBFB859|nr:hypothetical protein [Rhodoferax sp.]MBT9506099.1 hypothetical protein [Rhodoferax sp.]